VGSVNIRPREAPNEVPEPALTKVLSTLNQSLVWTGLAASASGVLVVSFLSRRTLKSVRILATAARRLGQGDFTSRVPVLAPAELGELGQTFNRMANDLKRAEEQRVSLMADVAHELSTPLSNIQGYIEAMRDGVVDTDGETLNTVHQQILQLGHLIEDVRFLALIDAGILRLNIEPDSIADVLGCSIEGFRPKANTKNISISLEIPGELPQVSMDRVRVTQVLANLLENALRHTAEGGSITVSATGETAGLVAVTVADTGEGIPPDDLTLIFERFHRVDASRTRETGGAGLGLTIAKQLIQAHNGAIHAESPPGSGTRLTFTLPTI
jgi:signal transduction histidine kinase